MKKIILFNLVLIFYVLNLGAQLVEDINGNVGIGTGSSTFFSKLTIGDAGNTDSHVNIYSENKRYALKAHRAGTGPSSSWLTGVWTESEIYSGHIVSGVDAVAYKATPINSGRAFGVIGRAGGSTTGYNVGVFGLLMGTQNGAGVVGRNDHSYDIYVDGRYSGYFVGDMKIVGTVNATLIADSDLRLKQNIESLNKKRGSSMLDKVIQLEPICYNYKQAYYYTDAGDTVAQYGLFDVKSQIFQKQQYGFVAQDLQEIYPELVYEQENGYLGINYTGLIPILVQSIKDLKSEIEELRNSIDTTTTNMLNIEEESAVLYQNTPNPFNQSTEIKYFLPQSVTNAFIAIYDLQGKQLKQIKITQRGEGTERLSGTELGSGMYLYALMADGQEVDVKRMILTD